MWDEQMPVLAHHYRVIRYDARGYGRSSTPTGTFSHEADLAALLQFLGVERTALVGLSGGGTIALNFALTQPERVTAFIPVGSGVSGYKWPAYVDPREDAMMAAFEAGDLDHCVEIGLQLWTDGFGRTSAQVDPAIRERVRAMTRHWLSMMNSEATPLTLEPPAVSRLKEIGLPTLVVIGEHDQPVMHTIADLLSTQIPGARKVVLPGTAHYPPLEQSGPFNALVLHFLGRGQNHLQHKEVKDGNPN
jgi:pimeloyl-ACP methyl ester carboxylesterase